jgi:BirA family biotin operon repressor/biotin-[acetyl-CoA-carboxylase] ligase
LRGPLAARILRELDAVYDQIKQGRFETVADPWEGLCTTIGNLVSIRAGDRVIQGRAESLDGEGSLLVRTEHGRLERVIGGDVTVLRSA